MAIDRPRRGTSHRRLLTLLLGTLAAGASPGPGTVALAAQETEGPLSPAGRLRVELAPSFTSWNSRFGPDGSEPLGTDLTGADAADLIPGVADLEATIGALLGDPSYQAALGAAAASVTAEQTRLPLRLDLGILDWLTVGVTVPLVRNRTELSFLYEGEDATLGVNPAVSDPNTVLTFFDALGLAEAAAGQRVEEACGADPGSGECTAARDAREGVASLMEGLEGAYAASPLFPTVSSPAGEALAGRLAAVSQALEAAGLQPIGSSLPLAAAALTDPEAFAALLEDPSAGLRLAPLTDRVGLWELGDVELHAVVRLLEGASRDSAGAPARARWQVGAGALVRLGTGSPDDPNIPFHRGSGDGQTDVEGRVFTNITLGRFGLWADARYGVQLSTTAVRRIAPPDVVLVPAVNLANVEWTPGDYLSLELAPRYHLTEALAFSLGYRLLRRGEDGYRRLTPVENPDLGPLPGGTVWEDASVLAEGTEQTLHQLGGGIVFSTLEMWREDRAPVPLEARFTVRASLAGSGGRTPAPFRTEMGVRIYHRFWGN